MRDDEVPSAECRGPSGDEVPSAECRVPRGYEVPRAECRVPRFVAAARRSRPALRLESACSAGVAGARSVAPGFSRGNWRTQEPSPRSGRQNRANSPVARYAGLWFGASFPRLKPGATDLEPATPAPSTARTPGASRLGHEARAAPLVLPGVLAQASGLSLIRRDSCLITHASSRDSALGTRHSALKIDHAQT